MNKMLEKWQIRVVQAVGANPEGQEAPTFEANFWSSHEDRFHPREYYHWLDPQILERVRIE
jgi:hypothetical protein